MKLERLDKLMVDKGLVQSRTQAQRLIDAGAVQARQNGLWIKLDKPSQKVEANIELLVDAIDELKYVSRAGLKLELALSQLVSLGHVESAQSLMLDQLVLDVGQSTGGFTDCALQCGARKVVGVDVGHGQLAARLRGDPRVTCMEGVNARELSLEDFELQTAFDVAVMDVSFISQTLILPALSQCVKSDGYLLSLVKPQFEVGKDGLAKGGIVKDIQRFPHVQEKVQTCLEELGLKPLAYFPSSITGSDGNQEFFSFAQKL